MGGVASYSGCMEPARPLRDVFADLVTDEDARRAHAADPDGFLQAHGHAELPGQLVSEAIANYADTAPTEVAEHLAPFVMAHSPVPVDGPVDAAGVDGLHLLATAPAEPYLDDLPEDALDGADPGAGHAHGHPVDPAGAAGTHDPFDLDFGHGDHIDDMRHVPHPGADGSDPNGAPAAGHLHETHADTAFTELEAGGTDHLVPEHADAGGWLDAGHHTVDAGHHVADVGDDLGAHGELLDAGHNLSDVTHDLDAHRDALDAGHDTPNEGLDDL
jgi:hypothetical protein